MCQSLTTKEIQNYKNHLRLEEKSIRTIEKYLRDVQSFCAFLPEGKIIEKEAVIGYKEHIAGLYAVSTVNTMLAAVNGFLAFIGRGHCRVKPFKQQRRIFRERDKELSKAEYLRLLEAAQVQGNLRLFYIMQTLCATGIRISELPFITVESLKAGRVTVRCKGKQRLVFLPRKLRRELESYCKQNGIGTGSVLITKKGKPVDRSNIWREMKKLCKRANVDMGKVYPHNFRHLFAVTFYHLEKDIAKLADLLGHTCIETTRIYIMESGDAHIRKVERLGLVV